MHVTWRSSRQADVLGLTDNTADNGDTGRLSERQSQRRTAMVRTTKWSMSSSSQAALMHGGQTNSACSRTDRC